MKIKSRIQQLFADDKARIAYLTAGDGGNERTLSAALALIKGGVNLLELGIPFSDPIADGPVIQRASARALTQGTTLQDILWLIKAIRQYSEIPLILFSYLNPILSVMASDFLIKAKQAGADGLLLVDCPLEESQMINDACCRYDLDLIYVITSNTSLTRIRKMNDHARGFLYYACQKGTTGMRHELPGDFKEKIQTIKSLVHLPVVVGFGISNQDMAKRVSEEADGVVVGSYFVKLLEEGNSPASLTMYARNIYP